MKAKATFLSYISAEKRLRKEQLKSNSAKNSNAHGEQSSQLEKRALMSTAN
ncbi:hypothetical protein [Rufibacter sp. XAAS-G3-1]|uniref:hypothetical protein n=1 Tax=Rufibacter sp. XAAS-G3-1 TaxID=2729134 RepID=UPI0015E7DF3C|nr:hypothetical protein [Rufibacter sp. XAAS-G3-1]